MPVMTKMYKLTGNPLYLEKLHEYWTYANSIMYDAEEGLYRRHAPRSLSYHSHFYVLDKYICRRDSIGLPPHRT